MQFSYQIHLAYCTNIHRGDDWAETFAGLKDYTMQVRRRVCPAEVPYAIGLRLSALAAQQLSEPDVLQNFREWLSQENCYVFTINGFPYGSFHNTRVKEQVYVPDWQSQERLDYTKQLFDILVQLLPPGVSGSVSTVPGSFKAFITDERQVEAMQRNLIECAEYIAALSETHGCDLHLGLEPEPFGYLETTAETIEFFDQLYAKASNVGVLQKHLGVNYDTCHMAIQYEVSAESIRALRRHGIRISKLHLSSALKVQPTSAVRKRLEAFVDPVYLHQVIARSSDGSQRAWVDLDTALNESNDDVDLDEEWRIHFHVPLHTQPAQEMDTTVDHLLGVVDVLQEDPSLCTHLEFETYTWEVLPKEMKAPNVVEQLIAEYTWCRRTLDERGIVLAES